MIIDDNYSRCRSTGSDIYQHLDTLKHYASLCDRVTEFGVRTIVSTWALLAGGPREMMSVDIDHPMVNHADLSAVYKGANEAGIKFTFVQKSTLDIAIPETDLLLLDTLHTYDHVRQELALHGNKAMKYIIIHDTVSNPEMIPAINEFINNNPQWKIREQFYYCNGMMVLEREEH